MVVLAILKPTLLASKPMGLEYYVIIYIKYCAKERDRERNEFLF